MIAGDGIEDERGTLAVFVVFTHLFVDELGQGDSLQGLCVVREV